MDFIKWRSLAIELKIDPVHMYLFINGKPNKLPLEKMHEIKIRLQEEMKKSISFIESKLEGGMEC